MMSFGTLIFILNFAKFVNLSHRLRYISSQIINDGKITNDVVP